MKRSYDPELMSFAYSLGRISHLNERFHLGVQRAPASGLGRRRTPAEYHVILSVLASDENVLSPTQLCNLTLQAPSGMTKTLRRLEDAGLIARVESTDDARFSMVRLTPSGRKLAQRLMKITLAAYRRAFGDLPAGEFAAMVGTLRTVRRILEESISA